MGRGFPISPWGRAVEWGRVPAAHRVGVSVPGWGGWRGWGAPSASGVCLAWGTPGLPVAPGPLGGLLQAAGRWRVPRRGRGGGGAMRIQLGPSAGDSARKWPVWALTARPPPKMNDPRIKARRGDRGT